MELVENDIMNIRDGYPIERNGQVHRYKNNNLAAHPYAEWREREGEREIVKGDGERR